MIARLRYKYMYCSNRLRKTETQKKIKNPRLEIEFGTWIWLRLSTHTTINAYLGHALLLSACLPPPPLIHFPSTIFTVKMAKFTCELMRKLELNEVENRWADRLIRSTNEFNEQFCPKCYQFSPQLTVENFNSGIEATLATAATHRLMEIIERWPWQRQAPIRLTDGCRKCSELDWRNDSASSVALKKYEQGKHEPD